MKVYNTTEEPDDADEWPDIVRVQVPAMAMFEEMRAHFPATVDALTFWREGDSLHIIGTHRESLNAPTEYDYAELRTMIFDFLLHHNQEKPDEETVQ